MWILQGISPTTFNVLSDVIGTVVGGLLVFALGAVYPYLVWESVKRGYPVGVDAMIAPPQSLWDAMMQFRHGGSRCLLGGAAIILAVSALSHTAADFFLDFVSVEVATNDTVFVGCQPAGTLPTYQLLGDTRAETTAYPATPIARLVEEADSIARGLSRFSIFSPDLVIVNSDQTTISGEIQVHRSEFMDSYNNSARPVPYDLQIQCQMSTQRVKEQMVVARVDQPGNAVSEIQEQMRHIRECDYQTIVQYNTVEAEIESGSWSVIDWTWYTPGPGSVPGIGPFGIRGDGGLYQNWINFTLNETDLAMSRELWFLGRKVRSGITLILGADQDENETHSFFAYHKPAAEVRVVHSVLTGPAITAYLDDTRYTLTSWSRACPVLDSSGELVAATFPYSSDNVSIHLDSETSSASGCLIDVTLKCNAIFPQDDSSPIATPAENPWCELWGFAVTLVRDMDEVDPAMLAAYAGIATRNGGLNNYNSLTAKHPVAVNSIAAAYIMTRESTNGTVAVEGVRASIGPGYVWFMMLPMIFLLPLLFVPVSSFLKKEKPLPVPTSIWDALVLGNCETTVLPKRPGSFSAFPSCPTMIKYGIVRDEGNDYGRRLGLADHAFVPLGRPLAPSPKQQGLAKATASRHEQPLSNKPIGAQLAAQDNGPDNPSHSDIRLLRTELPGVDV